MTKKPEKRKSRGTREGGEEGGEISDDLNARPLDTRSQEAAAVLGEQETWDPDAYIAELTAYQYDDHRRIIKALEETGSFLQHGEQYAHNWETFLQDEQNEAIKKHLLEKLHGTTIIDLGGGFTIGEEGSAPSAMQEVAQELGASTYISVDRYLRGRERLGYEPRDVTEEIGITQPERMHAIYVEDDMLRFLARMKSETPNITLTLNGIDAFLIPRHRDYGLDYHEMLAQEIARVLPKGGMVLTCGSEEATAYFEKLGLELADGFDKEGTAPPQVWIKK